MGDESLVSVAEQIAAVLRNGGRDQYNDLLFPVPTRLSLNTYSMVEVLTHRSGVSRNKMMNQLVEAGIDAVLSNLDDFIVHKLRESAEGVAQRAIDKNSGLMERGDL